MLSKPVVFANVNSGNLTISDVMTVEDILGIKVVVTRDIPDLERTIKEYSNYPPEIFGVMGGDGAIMHTRTLAENVWGVRPAYVFFPSGTKNNTQGSLGLKRKRGITAKICRALDDMLKKGQLDLATLPSIYVNGYKSFNTGIGVPTKLLWIEYGHGAADFLKRQKDIRNSEVIDKESIDKVKDTSTFRTIWEIYQGLEDETSAMYQLFSQRIHGSIRLDEQDWDHRLPRPLGIYLSCYEETNFGLPFLNPKPTPGAREVEGKLQIVAPYGTAEGVKKQLLKVCLGREMSNTLYKHVTSVDAPDQDIIEVDGEIIICNGFHARYDGEVKVLDASSMR